jgi:mercuric ion transport protein
MLTVELIYDNECPNIKDARAQLLRAFAETGLLPQWQEWDRNAPESPPQVRGYGSPTILVGGQDVADISPSTDADCCRLYMDDGGGLRGVPSVAAISSALLRAKGLASSDTNAAAITGWRWRNTVAVLPAIGTVLLPKVTCPACWPAYAGVLSALGFGFVNYTSYVLPLTIVFFALALAPLGYQARHRRHITPLLVSLLAALLVIIGKFAFVSDLAVYAGITLFVGASLWNSWLQRDSKSGPCPACIPAAMPSHLDTITPIPSVRR